MAAPLSILLLVGALGSASPPPLSAPPAKTGFDLSAFATLPSDPAPKAINNDTHYRVSNERRWDLFFRQVQTRGGVQIGVGAEQNWLLAGWSDPQVLVLMDFDQAVVDLQRVYRAFFARAERFTDFQRLWAAPESGLRVLRATREPGAGGLRAYQQARIEVLKQLQALQEGRWRLRVGSFLTDPAQYQRLHRLAQRGRVFVIRGDLTGPRTLHAIAAAARAARLRINTLYLSNAEQYFRYGPAFRENILDLPCSAHSVVLRTLPGRPRGFEYMVQRLDHFKAWLRRRETGSVYQIRGFRRGQHLKGETFKRLGGPPSAPARAPKKPASAARPR